MLKIFIVKFFDTAYFCRFDKQQISNMANLKHSALEATRETKIPLMLKVAYIEIATTSALTIA